MQIETVFEKLYGKPCWDVKPGFGSFLTMEFGEPHLEVREPIVASKVSSKKVRESLARRHIRVRGDWHLWINCCDWQVFKRSKWIGDSSDSSKIRHAAEFLNGQKLIGFSISSRKLSCIFEFDLGGILKTRPYDRESEQWLFFEPSKQVLTLRADGLYSYSRSDVPESQLNWLPLR